MCGPDPMGQITSNDVKESPQSKPGMTQRERVQANVAQQRKVKAFNAAKGLAVPSLQLPTTVSLALPQIDPTEVSELKTQPLLSLPGIKPFGGS